MSKKALYLWTGKIWEILGENGREMLLGSALVKIDGTGRIKIPGDFSKYIISNYGNELYITSDRGDSVLIYPLPVWKNWLKKVQQSAKNYPVLRKYLNITGYYGKITSIDKKERVLIQSILRERAKLEGELVLIGNIDHLVLWNKEVFEKLNIEKPLTDDDLSFLPRGED